MHVLLYYSSSPGKVGLSCLKQSIAFFFPPPDGTVSPAGNISAFPVASLADLQNGTVVGFNREEDTGSKGQNMVKGCGPALGCYTMPAILMTGISHAVFQ